MSELASQLEEREKLHQAQLQKERDESSRLKEQIEELTKSHQAEMERAAAEAKEHQEGQAREHKEQLDLAEARATSAQKELADLKGKANTWMTAVAGINAEMNRKFSLTFSFSLADITRMPTYFHFFQRTSRTPKPMPTLRSREPAKKEPRPAQLLIFGRWKTIWPL